MTGNGPGSHKSALELAGDLGVSRMAKKAKATLADASVQRRLQYPRRERKNQMQQSEHLYM